jgi:nucleoid DNA-binding protein
MSTRQTVSVYKAVSERTGLPQKMVHEVIDAYIIEMYRTFKRGMDFKFGRFGRFKYVVVPERTNRNPQTNEPVITPAHGTVKFRLSSDSKLILKDLDSMEEFE